MSEVYHAKDTISNEDLHFRKLILLEELCILGCVDGYI